VPRAGGGLYWEGDEFDQRDFRIGFDSSDKRRQIALADTIKKLKEAGWLSESIGQKSLDEIVDLAFLGKDAILRNSHLRSVIEYGRSVHAEMAALLDAARR
jgi:cytidine deaminase